MDAWAALQAELAALDRCQAEQAGYLPLINRAMLVTILQDALETALRRADSYLASDLIELYDIITREGALDADLKLAFIDVFHAKLDEAIADGDRATIEALVEFAAENRGFPVLLEDAQAAL